MFGGEVLGPVIGVPIFPLHNKNQPLHNKVNKIHNEWDSLQNNVQNRNNIKPSNFTVAQSNRNKNRYPDIMPYDNNRVILSKDNYINASKVVVGEKNFISCQAPLPQTFSDFWNMVWDNKTPVIVMLTKLIEGKKIKAHCYWPTTISQIEEFGDISVELTSMESDEKMVKRYFKVSKTSELETLQLLHIHYTEWPDFGVPESPKNIVSVINEAESYKQLVNALPTSPVIVHCSAGIGRAGTYLAIVAFLEHKKTSQLSFNTQTIVLNLRDQRMGMVQTFEQYSFIHTVIDSLL